MSRFSSHCLRRCISCTSQLSNIYYSFRILSCTLLALKAPQPPLSWSHTPEVILSITKETIEKTRKLYDRVATVSPSERSYETVILPLAHSEAEVASVTGPLKFYGTVSPVKELSDAANNAESLLRDFKIEASMRVDVFEAIKGAAECIEKSGQQLSTEEKRLVEHMLLDRKRNGLDLPEEKRAELTKVCHLF